MWSTMSLRPIWQTPTLLSNWRIVVRTGASFLSLIPVCDRQEHLSLWQSDCNTHICIRTWPQTYSHLSQLNTHRLFCFSWIGGDAKIARSRLPPRKSTAVRSYLIQKRGLVACCSNGVESKRPIEESGPKWHLDVPTSTTLKCYRSKKSTPTGC